MIERIYRNEDEYTFSDAYVCVYECSRKEFIEVADGYIENNLYFSDIGGCEEGDVYIEYDDGSFFYCEASGYCENKYRKTHIKGGIISDAFGYYVYGNYRMNENLILELV